MIANTPVPSVNRGDLVEFGIPKDKKDLRKGFVSLDMAEQVLTDSKGGKKKASGTKLIPNENPAGAGLVDGSILAFRFKSQRNLEMKEWGDENLQLPADPEWNVELPRYDDEEE
jgi:hypothetical protein